VAVAIWLVVRDDPRERGYESYYATDSHGARSASIAAQLAEVGALPHHVADAPDSRGRSPPSC
jgi:hypothetical protein